MNEKVPIEIWHNSSCSKSGCALEYLHEQGIEVEIFDYLNAPLTVEKLSGILKKLNISAFDLLRKNEANFEAEWQSENKTEEDWIKLMVQERNLIERPIVVKGNKAIIARPLQRIHELF